MILSLNNIKNRKNYFIFTLAFLFIIFFNLGTRAESVSVGVDKEFSLSAKNGAILIDSFTGDVLFEKNADKLAPVASTTKIIATMVVLERANNLDEPFVVDPESINVEGTSMGLKEGDIVTLRDLCYGMMLSSGNDAANAAAVRIAGSVKAFVKLMNDKAKELGLKNTFFVTPSGLDDVAGVSKNKKAENLTREDILKLPHSTARDMAVLTREAMKNPVFKKICSAKKVELFFGNPPYRRFLRNHNKLLRFFKPCCCGVKTGFTDKSGRCLVSAARKNGVELIAVVLNDKKDWDDSEDLLVYGFSKFKEYELPHDFTEVKPVILDDDEHEVSVKIEKPVKEHLTNSMKKRLKTKVKVSKLNFPPIESGEKIGEVDYYLDDKLLRKSNLVIA